MYLDIFYNIKCLKKSHFEIFKKITFESWRITENQFLKGLPCSPASQKQRKINPKPRMSGVGVEWHQHISPLSKINRLQVCH